MGFTLKIANPPAGTYWWIADFYENTFDYDPPAGSGALRINEAWVFNQDPRGVTSLHIHTYDINSGQVGEHVWNLGPVIDGKNYVYDYATATLEEEGIMAIDFDLAKPISSQPRPQPGVQITIACPVTSRSSEAVVAYAKFIIYEGSVWSGHGTEIASYTTPSFSISPNQTKNLGIIHTTVEGTIDRRDVEVEIYVAGELVKESEWDDIYFVEALVFDFDLAKPISSQMAPNLGTSITIACPVTSRSSEPVVASAKFVIYEGSKLYPWPLKEITSYTTPPFSISPNQTKNLAIIHTTVLREITGIETIDWRDVGVEIYVNGALIAERTWDDIYRVESDLKVLHFQILGEQEGGALEFDPMPIDAESHYYKGTVVNLRAIANIGFRFVMWRGEVDNPSSTSLTNTVTMSEDRVVKAEFAFIEAEQFYPLEVDITPSQGGYVTTDPPPSDIENHFEDDAVGKFPEGIRVEVTAHPNPGYQFDRWTDEIQGGSSFNNPEWVAGVMDEHRAVKAHFREVTIPPECSVDSDCPEGYVCIDGECVLEAEPSKFPWLPTAIIAGGAIVVGAAVLKKKPRT